MAWLGRGGRSMSIRARIAVFGTLVVAMALLVFAVLLDLLVAQSAPGEQDDRLRERAAEVVADLAVRPLTAAAAGQGGALSLAPINIRSSDETFVVVTDSAGETIAATGTLDGAPPRFALATLTGAAESIGGSTVDLGPNAEVRIAVSGLGRTDLGQSGYVVAGQSTRPLAEDRQGLRIVVLTAGAIALVTAFAASWRVAGRALKPLRAILQTVDEIVVGRRWRAPAGLALAASIVAYLGVLLARVESPDEVGVATKLVELLALVLLLGPRRERQRLRRIRATLAATGFVLVTMLTGATI